jgi:hypothetical protein
VIVEGCTEVEKAWVFPNAGLIWGRKDATHVSGTQDPKKMGKLPFGEDQGDSSATNIRKREHEVASRTGTITSELSVRKVRDRIWNKIE